MSKKKQFLFLFGLFYALCLSAQTLRIENAQNGEAISDCQLVKNNSTTLGFSNSLGIINLDGADVSQRDSITFLSLGFSQKKIAYKHLDTMQVVLLQPLQFNLGEVTVTDKFSKKMDIMDGEIKLNTKFLEQLPTVFGEPDLFKNFQLLPGITSAMENNTGIYVRGGASNQTLILVDGAPLFNSSHSAGFFSALSPAIVKSATLYKNAIPARFGTRASAVVDLELHDGNPDKFEGSAQFGIISSSINMKGPLQKRTKGRPNSFLNYQISARTTYIDKFLDLILSEEEVYLETGFEDYSIKLHKQIDLKRSLQLSYYRSDDRLSLPANFLLSTGQNSKWSNNLVNLSYFSNSKTNKVNSYHLYFSGYKIENEYAISRYQNQINNLGFRWNTAITKENAKHEYGLEANAYSVRPGRFANNTAENAYFDDYDLGVQNPVSAALYYTFNQNFEQSDVFVRLGGRLEQFDEFFSLQPRLLVKKELGESHSLSISYDRMAQFLNLYSANVIDLPTDIWYSSNEMVPPTISNSVSLDYSAELSKAWQLNVSTYVRQFKNAKDVDEGAPIFMAPNYQDDILIGINNSYGLEFLLQYNNDRFNGWATYTYSRSLNSIDGINNGDFYPANWDRPHVGNVVLNYKLASKWTLNGVFNVSTGRALTFPESTIGSILFYSKRNEYRLPPYHRLDVSIRKVQERHKHYQLIWSLNIYNIYSRRNPYGILRVPGTNRFDYVNLFPILPFFSLKVDFY